jgi:hypothetical protein
MTQNMEIYSRLPRRQIWLFVINQISRAKRDSRMIHKAERSVKTMQGETNIGKSLTRQNTHIRQMENH